MRSQVRILWTLASVLWLAHHPAAWSEVDEPERKPLAMSPAIACESIEGYDDYVKLDEAVFTEDDKLLVYYRSLNHKVEKLGEGYRALLSVDGAIRRKGEKNVLRRKVDVIKYDAKLKTPQTPLCFSHSASLKGLAPGDYEMDVTLHDRLDPGVTATQVVPFRIRPKKAATPKNQRLKTTTTGPK